MLRVIPFTIAAALFSSSLALCAKNGVTQMLSYVKRHPNYNRAEFWYYWYNEHAPKVAPLASYFNITRYQQVQVGGLVLPTEAGASEPASNVPVEFDGIAMFMYRKAEDLTAMLAHPYYTEVVLPDEGVFIDKTAFNGGQVAVFVGAQVEVVEDSKDVWIGSSVNREKYEQLFDSYN